MTRKENLELKLKEAQDEREYWENEENNFEYELIELEEEEENEKKVVE